MRKIIFQNCKELAKLREIELLVSEKEFNKLINSKKSAPSKVKIRWKCGKGHQWSATYNNIKQHKSGCPYCYGNVTISYQVCKELGKLKGFELLTSVKEFNTLMKNRATVPSKVKLRWCCSFGHKWNAVYNNIKHMDTGCPYCYGNLPISYQNCIKLAKLRGYEILTSDKEFKSLIKQRITVPSKVKIKWKCEKHHEWCAKYNDIQQGKGCPECAEGRYEEICRWYFEKIFKQKFHKIKLSKLITYYNGQMHLDGFAIVKIAENQINLAFEFNGIQHDEFPNFFHKTFQDFLERGKYDQEKKDLCENNGIMLIIFPQKIDMKMNHPEIIQGYIINEFIRKTDYRLSNIRQYNHLIEWYDWKDLDNYL